MSQSPPVPTPQANAEFAERYRAMSSRDRRFDGQFITGVHSTGIYCRPSCPATTPKASNVSFYLTSAAAHEAGLRACKRCLPDAVPGSPAWNLRDDLAGRAMRLIGDGLVERDGVTGLAAHLGYTPRHLTRVLVAELGAGPLALARAHRAQTARVLLVSTELPITDVAFAAGFGSVRQFNDTIAAVYERTPTALRASVRHPLPQATTGDGGTRLTLQLPARAPFDGPGLLRFLGVRALPGVEAVTRATTDAGAPVTGYARTLRLPHGPATIELALAAGGAARRSATGGRSHDAASGVTCAVWVSSLADLAPLVSRVRRLLDLDADAEAIDRALSLDPVLAPLVARTPGMRVPGSTDPHETLFRALVGQQVSVAAARTALTRLALELGEDLPAAARHRTIEAAAPDAVNGRDGPQTGLLRLFPTAAAIAAHGRDVLRGPVARVNTIVQTAQALSDGELVPSPGDTRDSLSAALQARPGIGPWTAGYVAMRVLGSPDILLTTDLALRQGAGRLGLPVTPGALAERGAAWAPWRSYAGMHLWGTSK